MNVVPTFLPSARTVELDVRVVVPAQTPMVTVAEALTRLAETVGRTWSYRQPLGEAEGRFEVRTQP